MVSEIPAQSVSSWLLRRPHNKQNLITFTKFYFTTSTRLLIYLKNSEKKHEITSNLVQKLASLKFWLVNANLRKEAIQTEKKMPNKVIVSKTRASKQGDLKVKLSVFQHRFSTSVQNLSKSSITNRCHLHDWQ